jgi:hypothetical protein
LGAQDFGISNKKNKRFYVLYNNIYIHFGSSVGNTYIDHKDKNKQKAWFARHSKIKNNKGQSVIKLKSSPLYWSANILWI